MRALKRLGGPLAGATLALLLFGCWPPATQAQVTLRWTRPDTTVTGNTLPAGFISGYFVQTSQDGVSGQFYLPTPDDPDTVQTELTARPGARLAARVVAVDKLDRAGLWSAWSDTILVDPGAPGMPLVIFIGQR